MTRMGTLIACLMVAACGELKVQVDVVNPNYLATEARKGDLLAMLETSLGQTDAFLEAAVAERRNDYRNVYGTIASEYEASGTALNLATPNSGNNFLNAANSLRVTATNQAVMGLGEFLAAVEKINQKIGNKFLGLDEKTQNQILSGSKSVDGDLAALLLRKQALVIDRDNKDREELGDRIESNFGNLLQQSANKARERELRRKKAELQATVEANATQLTNSLTQGNTLVSDPFAYAVAAAPPEAWAPKFNRAFAGGYLGNTDIAIKLESLGDFTIKGVAFDPSTVAQVAAKVTTQAAIMAAQIYGVPIKTPESKSTGDGAALAESSRRLADVQSGNLTRAALLKDYQDALIDIANAVTREKDKFKTGGDDGERGRAIKAIKITFDEHKQRLDLSSLAGN